MSNHELKAESTNAETLFRAADDAMNSKDNARLIAAAPALLQLAREQAAQIERLRAALAMCVELGERSIAYPRSAQKRGDLEVSLRNARAALAQGGDK